MAEVPKAWRADVPADFDFGTEMLVVMPGTPESAAVTVKPPPFGFEQVGDDVHVFELAAVRRTPALAVDCSDPQRCSCTRRADAIRVGPAPPRPMPQPLYRVPKTRGQVYRKRVTPAVDEATAMGPPIPQCAPCGIPCP